MLESSFGGIIYTLSSLGNKSMQRLIGQKPQPLLEGCGLGTVYKTKPRLFPNSTNMQGDEQHVQGGGLFRGWYGLALELEFAELHPANSIQVGAGVHVLEKHQQSTTMLVFDGLEVDLAKVLCPQHTLWWTPVEFR